MREPSWNWLASRTFRFRLSHSLALIGNFARMTQDDWINFPEETECGNDNGQQAVLLNKESPVRRNTGAQANWKVFKTIELCIIHNSKVRFLLTFLCLLVSAWELYSNGSTYSIWNVYFIYDMWYAAIKFIKISFFKKIDLSIICTIFSVLSIT